MTIDCKAGYHEDCIPCDCECHNETPRREPETREQVEREGLKKNILQGELLDLLTLMPDFQLQDIADYIKALRGVVGK